MSNDSKQAMTDGGASKTAAERTTDVLITGAGPVGMLLHLLCVRAGVESLLIEKHPGISRLPNKARYVSPQSMRILRAIGLEAKVRENELHPKHGKISWVESATGKVIAAVKGKKPDLSSNNRPSLVMQHYVEAALLEAALKEAPHSVLFNKELLAFDPVEGQGAKKKMVSHILDKENQEEEKITARYVIGCDGAHSTVRRLMGVDLSTMRKLGLFQTIHFLADVKRAMGRDAAMITLVAGGKHRGDRMMAVDFKSEWILVRRATNKDDVLPPVEAIDYVRSFFETQDMPVTIRSLSTWLMSAFNSPIYKQGNVLIAGDAAHTMPPAGGMGMNTGLEDAYYLASLLVKVIINGEPPSILEQYQKDRRPVAGKIIQWSAQNGLRVKSMLQAIGASEHQEFARLQEEQKTHMRGIDQITGLAKNPGQGESVGGSSSASDSSDTRPSTAP
jgi:putative polyketide hydroxylase